MNASKLFWEFSQETLQTVSPGDSVLIALSGGCDSVCLLHLFTQLAKQAEIKLFAAHLNHQLRDTANRDEKFVKELCDRYQIPLFCERKNIREFSAKDSLENCARKIRYEFFQKIIKEHQIRWIATAHHKNDNAESILLHLTRGSGLNGLCSMQKKHTNSIIRPLLPFSRKELEAYARTSELSWVEDETNQDVSYSRNRIRHCVIPQLEAINPGFVDVLYENSTLLSEDEAFLTTYTRTKYREIFDGTSLDWDALYNEPIAIRRRLIQMLYREMTQAENNLAKYHIDAILSLGQSGKTINLPGKVECRLEFHRLVIEQKSKSEHYLYPIFYHASLEVPEADCVLLLRNATPDDKDCFIFPKNAVLTVRNRKNGDYFYPEGFGKRKKLSDFLIDEKIPQSKRNSIALLLCNEDIVSVIGLRRDYRYLKKGFHENGYVLEIIKK